MAAECKHETGTLIDRATLSLGARCNQCGTILRVNGVPLKCPDCRQKDGRHLGGCIYHPDPARRHPFGNTLADME